MMPGMVAAGIITQALFNRELRLLIHTGAGRRKTSAEEKIIFDIPIHTIICNLSTLHPAIMNLRTEDIKY